MCYYIPGQLPVWLGLVTRLIFLVRFWVALQDLISKQQQATPKKISDLLPERRLEDVPRGVQLIDCEVLVLQF